MRTTLNLDDQALSQALEASDGLTKTELVNEALRQYARTRQQKRLLDLRGKVDWQGDIDALRKRT